jgi:hypothetical protein
MSGAKHRQKGNRIEREIVATHLAIGIKAERSDVGRGQLPW